MKNVMLLLVLALYLVVHDTVDVARMLVGLGTQILYYAIQCAFLY